MAALFHDHRPPTLHASAVAAPVARFFGLDPEGEEVVDPRPALRVIPGGREAALRIRRTPAVYRRRRLGVLLAVLTLVVVTALGIGALQASTATAGDHQTPPDAVSSSVPPGLGTGPEDAVGGDAYVVQPGDTLWSIAERLQPEGDVRPLVDRLAAQVGPSPLEAGVRLDLASVSG